VGKRRLFLKTRSEVDTEGLRQKTLLSHSREGVGLTPCEISGFLTAAVDVKAAKAKSARRLIMPG